MFDFLLTDCRIATMCQGGKPYGTIEKGAMGIKGDLIAWIGEEKDLPSLEAKERLKLDGAWVTPGLIDCHTHFVFGGNRIADFEARNKGASYQDIAAQGGGIRSTMRATREASPEDLLTGAMKRLSHFLAEGVTTMEIKSGYGLTLEDERKCLKVAGLIGEQTSLSIQRTFLGAHSLPPEFTNRGDEYIDEMIEHWLPALNQEGLIDAVDGFCENIAFSVAQIERLFQKAILLGLPVKLHAEQLSHLGGTSLAAKYRALSADHLEYAQEEDILAMKQSGTIAVLLPGAFYYLREKQLPPIAALRCHQIPIALASDHNPGTSPLSSLLPAPNLGVIMFHLTPEEALIGVTRNAALALGLNDRGTLEMGKRADIAIWHIEHPAELSYWVGTKPCHLTFHAGKIR